MNYGYCFILGKRRKAECQARRRKPSSLTCDTDSGEENWSGRNSGGGKWSEVDMIKEKILPMTAFMRLKLNKAQKDKLFKLLDEEVHCCLALPAAVGFIPPTSESLPTAAGNHLEAQGPALEVQRPVSYSDSEIESGLFFRPKNKTDNVEALKCLLVHKETVNLHIFKPCNLFKM